MILTTSAIDSAAKPHARQDASARRPEAALPSSCPRARRHPKPAPVDKLQRHAQVLPSRFPSGDIDMKQALLHQRAHTNARTARNYPRDPSLDRSPGYPDRPADRVPATYLGFLADPGKRRPRRRTDLEQFLKPSRRKRPVATSTMRKAPTTCRRISDRADASPIIHSCRCRTDGPRHVAGHLRVRTPACTEQA